MPQRGGHLTDRGPEGGIRPCKRGRMSKWSGFVSWLDRARHHIAARDLLWLTPPGVLAILAGFARGNQSLTTGDLPPAAAEPPDLSRRDPELVELIHDLFRALGQHYFRLQITGAENLPPS